MKQAIIWAILLFSVWVNVFLALWSDWFDNVIQREIIRDNTMINITNVENEITGLVEKLSPWVASIIVKKDLTIYRSDPYGFFKRPVGTVEQKVGGGTAFFITEDWYLLTNKHVVADKDALYTVITHDQKEYDATILAIDPLTDLAIVKIDSVETFKKLEFISPDENIKIGQFAIAIWNSLSEFQNSVSFGVISGKNRTIEAWWDILSWLLQTDTAINPGNSGWPLVNLSWQVIGINTAIVQNTQWLGFSIALNQKKIDFILDSVKKYGEIKKPFIGINYVIINENLQKELKIDYNYGAYIFDEKWSIVPGSSAEISWLEPGDIVLELDGTKITRGNDLQTIIQNKIPGEKIELKVYKKEWNIKYLDLELGKEL